MGLRILLADELRGFYRSKVMLTLWLGLPLMALVIYAMQPDLDGMAVSQFIALMIGSIGGTLTSIMIAIGILNDRENGTLDLFFVRPVKRRDILISKFIAVYGCVVVASMIAVIMGTMLDAIINDIPLFNDLEAITESIIMSMAMMSICCAAGVMIGVVAPSMLVGIILVLYGGNQLAGLVLLPVLQDSGSLPISVAVSATLSILLLVFASMALDRMRI